MPEVIQANHQSSRTEDPFFSKSQLEKYDNECADIYFLTQREICLVLSCLRLAEWDARWEDRDSDHVLVSTLERKLLMLCAEDLVKSNLMIFAALTGRDIDLSDSEAIQTLLNSPLTFTDPKDAVVPAIDRITENSEDYSDELTAIATDVTEVATILGYVAI